MPPAPDAPPPRLSICIPTHHGRAETLEQALASLADQLRDDAEVCISDNASEDGTEAIVREFADRVAVRVAYRRHPVSLGFTANLLDSVELARGEYCWLFSSDDAVAPGGLDAVRELIDRHPDAAGFTLRPTLVDVTLAAEVTQFADLALPVDPELEHRFTTAEDALAECGFIAGVLPTQVVRSELWRRAVAEDRASARAPYFPHMRYMALVLRREANWVWYPGRTFLLRTGRGNSVVDDLQGDVLRYNVETSEEQARMWLELLGPRSPARRRLMLRQRRSLFSAYSVGLMRHLSGRGRVDDRRLARFCLRHFGRFGEFWLFTAPMLFLPRPLLSVVFGVGPPVRRGLLAVREALR